MALRWYVLHAKPHKEYLAWQHVRLQGFETFYPQVQAQPTNPRARKVKPYFPGYLFVRADLNAVGVFTFQWMPFVHGLFSYGEEPTLVPDTLISALQQRVSQINQAAGELFYNLKPSDPVVVRRGPLAGYAGIFEMRLSGQERVQVLLHLLNDRAVTVKLHAGYVERAYA